MSWPEVVRWDHNEVLVYFEPFGGDQEADLFEQWANTGEFRDAFERWKDQR